MAQSSLGSSGSLACVARPRAAALSIGLGVTAGFVTGDNLTICLLLAAAAVLRLPLVGFAVAWALGLWAGWLLVPLCFVAGQAVLDTLHLGTLLSTALGPVALAVLGWDRYTIVGGLLLGPLLALPCAWALAFAQRRVAQRPCITSAADEQVLLIGPSATQRLLAWLAGTTFLTASASRGAAQRSYWRPPAWAWTTASVAALTWAALALPSRHFTAAVLNELSTAVGVPLRADAVEVSAADGRIHILGLRALDPQGSGREILRAEEVTGKISTARDILAGQFAFDQVLVRDLRAIPSSVETPPQILPEFAAALHEEHGASSAGPVELLLEGQLVRGGAVAQRLHYAHQALGVLASLQTAPTHSAEHSSAIHSRAAMRAARSSLGRAAPHVSIEYLQIDELPVCWNLGRDAVLRLRGFNTATTADAPPVQIDLSAPELTLTAAVSLSRSPTAPHHVRLHLDPLPAADVIAAATHESLHVVGGTVQIDGQGVFLDDRLQIELSAIGENLRTEVTGSHNIAGITPVTWSQCLAAVPAVHARATLVGTMRQPRLRIDAPAMVDTLARALRDAGSADLAATLIDEQSGNPVGVPAPQEAYAQAPPEAPATIAAAEPHLTAVPGTEDTAALPAPDAQQPPAADSQLADAPVEPDYAAPIRPAPEPATADAQHPEIAGATVESAAPSSEAAPHVAPAAVSTATPPAVAAAPAQAPVADEFAADDPADGVYNPLRGRRAGQLHRQGLARGTRNPQSWEAQRQAQAPAQAPEPPVLDTAVAERELARPQPSQAVATDRRTDSPVPGGPTAPAADVATTAGPRTTPPVGAGPESPVPSSPYVVHETTAAPIPATPFANPTTTPAAPTGPQPTVVTATDPQASRGPLDFEVGYDEQNAPLAGMPVPAETAPGGNLVVGQRAMAVTTTDPEAARGAAGPAPAKSSLWARMKSMLRRKPATEEGTSLAPPEEPRVAGRPKRSLFAPRGETSGTVQQ
ncbi:MAG: hypothetical protein K1X74_01530 [Pirellulales bacterium]|nr:hypothetical protein [Pirellulales bacterium]